MSLKHFFSAPVVAVLVIVLSGYLNPGRQFVASAAPAVEDSLQVVKNTAASHAAEARRFVKQKGYNENLVFLIDMSVHSGKKRFFIYDLKADSVVASSLVSHGVCYGGEPGARFSNIVGSGCSSLGKYRIGKSYYGQWGYSYKLHGLDATNNNAYERTVVLHAHDGVPDSETDEEIALSLGCPMVSPVFLQKLKKIINGSSKPVMLWIYQ
jgi:hypothetical protein